MFGKPDPSPFNGDKDEPKPDESAREMQGQEKEETLGPGEAGEEFAEDAMDEAIIEDFPATELENQYVELINLLLDESWAAFDAAYRRFVEAGGTNATTPDVQSDLGGPTPSEE